MNINEFKTGDYVTRITPVQYSRGALDRSYMGDPLRLIGIEHSLIVLKRSNDFLEPIVLPVDLWQEGWAPYPMSLIIQAF